MQSVKTILADDQRIFIEGLKTVLSTYSPLRCEIVGIAYSGRELLRLLQLVEADLLIFDLNLPEQDGLQVLKKLRSQRLALRVLVLSRYHEPKIVKSAFKAGVDGYILKDKRIDELFAAVREVMSGNTFVGEGVSFNDGLPGRANGNTAFAGAPGSDNFVRKHYLTKRELEILRLITDAMSNKQIAKELYISDQTVSVHRKNIMRKLGVSNTAALIKTAYENSLV